MNGTAQKLNRVKTDRVPGLAVGKGKGNGLEALARHPGAGFLPSQVGIIEDNVVPERIIAVDYLPARGILQFVLRGDDFLAARVGQVNRHPASGIDLAIGKAKKGTIC